MRHSKTAEGARSPPVKHCPVWSQSNERVPRLSISSCIPAVSSQQINQTLSIGNRTGKTFGKGESQNFLAFIWQDICFIDISWVEDRLPLIITTVIEAKIADLLLAFAVVVQMKSERY